jgi:putative ABC transport system permease protein
MTAVDRVGRLTTPARLSAPDVLRVGSAGLRTRPLRAFLSALGIAIGIAAMLSVVGLAASSTENINRQLDKFGTNLLRVSPGETVFGDAVHLPLDASAMIGRIDAVTSVSMTGTVRDVHVYRNDRIPPALTGSISVLAARPDLLGTVGAGVRSGTWLNAATSRYPAVVLGSRAAARLGIGAAGTDVQVWLGNRWFTVVGVLGPAPLAPELDTSALIGWQLATADLTFDGYPTTIYTRTRDDSVAAVSRLLAATANPQHPNEVNVSRPSDILLARATTDAALRALLIGLGGVSLLVGGIGVANTMIISVLERRSEVGLRRSLGATRGQIRIQFLAESLLLSALGGIGGALLGVLVTVGFAAANHWPAVVPAWASGGGIIATLVIGTCAGLYPAWRAARLSPTEALNSP